MRLIIVATALCLAGWVASGCFYEPDRDKIEEEHPREGGSPDAGGEYGQPCEDDADCEDYEEATYCLVNPIDNQGGCTQKDCSLKKEDACPSEFICCDCPAQPPYTDEEIVACMPESQAALLEGFCTCGS